MVVLYLAQYSIFENVLITISLSKGFVPQHLVREYVPTFYLWVFFGCLYQAAHKASPA